MNGKVGFGRFVISSAPIIGQCLQFAGALSLSKNTIRIIVHSLVISFRNSAHLRYGMEMIDYGIQQKYEEFIE